MIENLNQLSIKPYGKVTPQTMDEVMRALGFRLIKQRQITNEPPGGVFVNHHSQTVIDILDGTSIIYLGRTKAEMTPFFIDKIIILNPGIYYYVIPVLFSATIASSSEIPPVFEECSVATNPFINPDFQVSKILTLFYQEKEAGFSFRGETHDFWELTYVDKGMISNQIDGTEYVLKQGELMLFAPGEYHTQKSLGSEPVSFLTISFLCEKPLDFALSRHVFSANNDLYALFDKILYEKQHSTLYTQDMMLCYLKETLILLLRSVQVKNLMDKADTRIKRNIENDIINQAKQYVAAHVKEKIQVEDIAKSIPLSNSYLSTLFKKNTGISITHYINQEKVDFAKSYLRSGKHSATEVSLMLSFSSVHYFTRVFKKLTGFPPGEYANSLKE